MYTSNFAFPAGSEEAQDQDSLDGGLPSASGGVLGPRAPTPPPSGYTKAPANKGKRNRRHTKESPSSSESGDEQQQPTVPQPSKPALKATMDRAHSNFSHKSGASKVSKGTKLGSSNVRPPGKVQERKGSQIQLSPFSGILWDRREPFTQLWVTLSAMYGKLLVLLMFAFCLVEVMDNKVPPLTFQGFFMMYLYCGSIIAIMCIYITVLLDNCPSVTNSRENLTSAGDPEVWQLKLVSSPHLPIQVGSIGSLGTLKRAHISRNKVSRTSFYLRVGALGKLSSSEHQIDLNFQFLVLALSSSMAWRLPCTPP